MQRIARPSEDRALAMRMRPDLEMSPQRFGRQSYWVVKDPVALAYYHLREEEHAVLTMLDGRTGFEEIRRRCGEAFAPRTVGGAQLHGFLATLHRHGLVLAETSGQGEQLLLRHDAERRRRRYQSILGALAIRFRGLNPQRFLDWLYPKSRWLFSPLCVAAFLLLVIAAVALVTVEFDTLSGRLPEFRSILAASNWPWLILVLAATKILHELGHALACRHFGGDCHEIGVMFLIFVPCLYCNVSDSWMLASKWRRIAVAAAGIYVELVLASIATLLWWSSAPGLFNALCLNTMLICSLGTLLFNGNPLLRYDGYYILSDLIDVPNLGAESLAAARRIAARWFLGLDLADERMLPARSQGLLATYAIASTVYRWVVVVAILWGLYEVAKPYELAALVVLLGCVTVVGMVAPLVAAVVRLARDPSTPSRMAPARVGFSGALLFVAAAVVLFVKLPMRVAAPVVVEYRDAQRVYVTVSGTLTSAMRTAQAVEKGETIAQLDNSKVRLEVAKLSSERDRQQLYLANLEAQKLQNVIDGAQIPTAKAALADLQSRLEQFERDAARLTITAPSSGTLLPPPSRPRATRSTDKLDTWSGVPLDPRNLGSHLETGTLLCLVGDPNRFEAVLHIEQSDIELVEVGQRVRMVLDHVPDEVVSGTVIEIAKLDLKVMPRELAAARDLPTRVDPRGVSHPLDTWYQARVVFDEQPAHLVARVHGRAKIAVAPQSIVARLTRSLRQTFSR